MISTKQSTTYAYFIDKLISTKSWNFLMQYIHNYSKVEHEVKLIRPDYGLLQESGLSVEFVKNSMNFVVRISHFSWSMLTTNSGRELYTANYDYFQRTAYHNNNEKQKSFRQHSQSNNCDVNKKCAKMFWIPKLCVGDTHEKFVANCWSILMCCTSFSEDQK